MYWINKIRQSFLVRIWVMGLMLLPLMSPLLPTSAASSLESGPPSLAYETVYNAGWLDSGQDVAADADGNAYVLAQVYDNDDHDVLVLKLAPDGSIDWTASLSGSAFDIGTGLTLDAAGDVYVSGLTDSADFPTVNPFQSTRHGFRDAFITKLSAADGSILYSTYFGGSRSDGAHDVAVNSAGEIYLVGYTGSTDLPTVNPIQPNLNTTQCFCDDAFVSKLSADGGTLLYSTYLGGSFDDAGASISLDANDNIYLAGDTKSDDFPLQSPIQSTYGGGFRDVFAARISADGSSLDYSTFLGGEEGERVNRIAVDGAGSLYLTGPTTSIAYPTTVGAFQPDFVGGILACGSPPYEPLRNCADAFVSKLAPDGSALAYSTFLGGDQTDESRGIALDSAGNAYLVGYTFSSNFPGIGTSPAIFVSKLNADGSDLAYTVPLDALGSTNQGHGVALDGAGGIYVTGARNVPSDVYVAKLAGDPPDPGNVLHVQEITIRPLDSDESPSATSQVDILILDQNDVPVEGAEVFVEVKGSVFRQHTLSGVTDAEGRATLEIRLNGGSEQEVCVTDVVKEGFDYDPTENGETCQASP